jgi:hypothetical protein
VSIVRHARDGNRGGGQVPGKDDAIVDTTHFIADENELCGASLTPSCTACFKAWEHRAKFEAKYQRFLGERGMRKHP